MNITVFRSYIENWISRRAYMYRSLYIKYIYSIDGNIKHITVLVDDRKGSLERGGWIGVGLIDHRN